MLEKRISDIKFVVHKFTPRPRPLKKDIFIFPIFSEFGCEMVTVVYCLPELLKNVPGKYTIVMGWHGRKYLYQHLVDEFWEIDESNMWLREFSRAFHHVSKNLQKAEKKAKQYGNVIDVAHLGNVAVFPKIETCPHCKGKIIFNNLSQQCSSCNTPFPKPGLFTDVRGFKKKAVWLPSPSQEKINFIKDNYLPSRPVVVTARARKTYGRNIDPIFYERLIYLLEDLGYNPVWVGEKTSTLPCPFKRIVDFSNTEYAKDLEMTLALISQAEFTVQFFTASSRLAAVVGTPYIIFESHDQICGNGQEGMRLNLLTRGNKKRVICHYKNVNENHGKALELLELAVRELRDGNYNDIIDLVENKEYVEFFIKSHRDRIGDD